MGTFIGHAMPGTFLFIMGSWWAFFAWRNYVRSREQKRPYVCRCSYPIPCLSQRFSFEGIAKIVTCSVGISDEVDAGIEYGYFVNMACAQHISMYLFYLLSGVVDVMTSVRFPFPPYTDYVVLLLAVTVEGLLFHFHLHGRDQLDVLVHTLLVYTIAAEAACILVEMCRPRSVLASLGRACFCLLQATWLWQIGFILYSPLPEHPPWDVHSHSDMMLAASVFTWHIVAVLAYLGALGAVAWAVNRTCGRCCKDAFAVLQDDDDLCQALVKE
ncbi:transmembrane protein 45B-like [Dermacentor andersoni]|uniref:transmembrane protein 45B-like n=1 Tax=Dermacentor andersoni TaxID=34620 RepID=UPI0021553353|nr:transmembrane protein 45B-like [Dermacentor andersoni]